MKEKTLFTIFREFSLKQIKLTFWRVRVRLEVYDKKYIKSVTLSGLLCFVSLVIYIYIHIYIYVIYIHNIYIYIYIYNEM